MKPVFDIDKIKYATDPPTFERAVKIYETGGVINFKYNGISGFFALVRGSKDKVYEVIVDQRFYDRGSCDCYLGQNDRLCKHMVAVAIYAVMGGKKLKKEDKQLVEAPKCSGEVRVIDKKELSEIKKQITASMRYIKPYKGPSRTWFDYQNSLDEGCARLSELVSNMPVNQLTAGLLIDLLLRLDKKLSMGGVDDSDGTVGSFMEDVVLVLVEFVKFVPKCKESFKKLKDRETMFGWEEPLLDLM